MKHSLVLAEALPDLSSVPRNRTPLGSVDEYVLSLDCSGFESAHCPSEHPECERLTVGERRAHTRRLRGHGARSARRTEQHRTPYEEVRSARQNRSVSSAAPNPEVTVVPLITVLTLHEPEPGGKSQLPPHRTEPHNVLSSTECTTEPQRFQRGTEPGGNSGTAQHGTHTPRTEPRPNGDD
jgi:hypothetical protein